MDARSAARILGGEARGQDVFCPGPGHGPRDRSIHLTFDPNAPRGFVLHSFAGDDEIAAKDGIARRLGLEPWKPNGQQRNNAEPYHGKLGKPTYVFRYDTGVVCRWEHKDGSKDIRPAIRVGDTWKWVSMPVPRPLYRRAQLMAMPSKQVIIVEGEKKADALADALKDIAVVSWAGGARAIRQTDWSPLAGRKVIIWPDNDAPGAASVGDIGTLLTKAGAASIRYLPPMGAERPEKWDAWDAIHTDRMDGAAIIAWAKARVREWSPDETVDYVAPPPSVVVVAHAELMPSDSEAPPYSDEALALYFAAVHAGALRYVARWNRWKIWDGARWMDDETLAGYDHVREICRDRARVYAEIAKGPGGPKAMASAKTVNAVLALSRSDKRIAATTDQWDRNDGLLNTPAGTVDLETLAMRPHDPSDHITKITAVAPGGECPTWIRFLERVTGGDLSLQLFLRRMCGYALSGDTREHALFFLYGLGANGKSVLINTVSGIMGDYHKPAPIETFTLSHSDRHPTELARLHGARLVTAQETEEGRRWAESRIKSLTGGDKVSARFMKQDFFEYVPKFKLLIAGNHKPGLRSVDEAIRRRFNLIPFAVTIPIGERDEKLTETLKSEWSGILQWMLVGCLEWQRLRSLQAPDVVTAATADYLVAEDAIAAWVDECCDIVATATAYSAALYASWKNWATRTGEVPGSQKRFSQTLESRGYEKLPRTSSGMQFRGLLIKPENIETWYRE